MQTLVVDRYELKYTISSQQYHLLSRLLAAVLDVDEHANADRSYYIRSLYFDTPDNMDFYAKEDGLYERKKIRLRLYDLDQTTVKVEVKNKYGGIMKKESAFIEKEDAKRLMSGDYDCLLNYESASMGDIYKALKTTACVPKVIIDYQREAYVCKAQNVRINFDRSICANATHLDLFDKALPMTPLSYDESMVLEVKYTTYIPDFLRDILSACLMNKTSYSKYCIARSFN